MLIFDTKDAAQTRRAYDVVPRLAAEAGKRGYGEYRAHLDFMDLAADQYTFNDHAYRRFCERSRTPSTRTASSRPVATGSGRSTAVVRLKGGIRHLGHPCERLGCRRRRTRRGKSR